MTVADWAIVGLAALTALAGLRRGLVASAFALAGLLAGAILGARFAPRILSEGDTSPYTPLVGLAGAVLLASFLHGVGGFVGSFFRGSLRWGPLRAVDSAGGLLIGALTGFGIAWVVGAAALHVPGQTRLREEAQRSRVLRELNELAPPQTVLDVLARIDPFPAIAGPPPPAEPPDSGILHSPAVVAAASSVVRVLGTACGVGVAGTGWVYRPGVVVTAAHVVSGEKDTVVVPYGSSTKIRALPVAVDARNDVAVLRVAGLRAPALRLVDPEAGTAVAILGYPGNGPFDAEAGRIGETAVMIPRGDRPLPKQVTSVAGRVRHGNSGGPAVDMRGAVQTMVFASDERAKGSGFGVPASLIRAVVASAQEGVSTGGCVP